MINNYSPTWFKIFLDQIDPAQTEREVAFIIRHLPRPACEKVLDVCCGAGRHAGLLSGRGYLVTGIDLNDAVIEQARRNSGSRVTYLQLDMRQLAGLPGIFNAVISLWQSFGYFDDSTNANILRQISRKLTPNGRLILDIYHRSFFEQQQGVRGFERNGVPIVETRSMTDSRLTVHLEYGRLGRDTFDWQLYTPHEICEQASRFGFAPIVVCADFDECAPASPGKPRMQLVFEKRT